MTSELSIFTDGKLEWHPEALLVREDLTQEEFRHCLRRMKVGYERFKIGVGDLMRWGERRWSREWVFEEVKQLELPLLTVEQGLTITSISAQVRLEMGLSGEHYFVLAKKLGDDKEAILHWAELARKEKLTALELAGSIDAGRVERKGEHETRTGRNSGVTTIQAMVGLEFTQWLSRVGGRDEVLRWPRDQREQLVRDLRPVTELAREVAETL